LIVKKLKVESKKKHGGG